MRAENQVSTHPQRTSGIGAGHKIPGVAGLGGASTLPNSGGFLSLLASFESEAVGGEGIKSSDSMAAFTEGSPDTSDFSFTAVISPDAAVDGAVTESLQPLAQTEQNLGAITLFNLAALLPDVQSPMIVAQSQLAMQFSAENRDAALTGNAVDLAHAGIKTGGIIAADAAKMSSALDSLLAQRLDHSASGKQQAGDQASDATKAVSDGLVRVKADESRSPGGHVNTDLRAFKVTHIAETAAKISSLTDVALAGSVADALRKPEERALFRPAGGRVDGATDGVWGGYLAPFSGARMESSVSGSTVDLVAPEVMVAEQVNYWISHDVQNAELKLSGFDGLPVEVSISMHGKEARVDFRTDQAEIRDILQEAEPHLKEMLAKEGLVLSGVSVGTSAQNPNDAQDRQGRQGRTLVMPDTNAIPAPAISPLGSQRVSDSAVGRALDIFV